MSNEQPQPALQHISEPDTDSQSGAFAKRPGTPPSPSPMSVCLPARTGGAADRVEPELLRVADVARVLNCSQRQVYRLSDGGKMPRPVKLGGSVRWRRGELQDWIGAGCPSVRAARAGGTRK